MSVNKCSLLIVLFYVTLANPSFSQQSNVGCPDSSKIKVMVLGTFHFQHTPDFYDIKSEAKQRELEKVIASLAQFSPDKIAIEASYEDSAQFDSLYQSYVNGTHHLNKNERQQLGFRLAKKLNHKSIYSIDYKQPWPYAEVMNWAKKNKPEFIRFYKNWKAKNSSYQDILYKHATLAEILKWLNGKEHRNLLNEVRMRRTELGGTTNFVGVKAMSSSYDRNLKIFSNLTSWTDCGENVLVIYGSGHNYFLKEFIQMHPDMELVQVSEYL